MDDDLNSKIMQIVDLLGKDKIPDNISNLISAFVGSSSADRSDKTAADITNADGTNADKTDAVGSDAVRSDAGKAAEPAGDGLKNRGNDDMELLFRIKKMIDGLNTANDRNINLLSAIRPFLSKERQEKASNCIQLLRLSRLSKMLINDNERSS